jgi:poly(A)-specific ribonuclease
MIITTYRAEYEDRKRSQRQAEFNDKLQRQKGVRWLVEAMTRGDLLKLNPLQSMRMQDGKPVFMDVPALTKKHNELQERLKNKRTVLVGHNVFVDLVYFYKTFFGRLPDQVEEFARKIHELFPLVVDTKYLATSSGSMVAGSSLADQDDLHAGQHVPIIGKFDGALRRFVRLTLLRHQPIAYQVQHEPAIPRSWL